MFKRSIFFLVLTMLLTVGAGAADLAPQMAWTLYQRLTGVPPAPGSATFSQMIQLIRTNSRLVGLEKAAALAVEEKNFYNVLLANWLKPWSNQEMSNRVPLNDYVATLIGAIRDSDKQGKPFSRVLYEDLVYVGPTTGNKDNNFSRQNNNHYEAVESLGQNYKDILVEKISSTNVLTEPTGTAETSNLLVNGMNGAAGVLTSYQAGKAFYSAGTNRRVTRFTFMNFLCKDFEALHDTSIADFRVRRDVDRNAGGDSRTFKNKCVGCHAGQDALGGAFAYYDFPGDRLRFSPGSVVEKMNKGASTFPGGYVTKDDSWINLWASGQNSSLGWRSSTQGNGVKALGQMLAASRAFSQCMAQKVFKLVCYHAPDDGDKNFIEQMADEFEKNDQYNMKNLFVKISAKCVNDKYE